MFPVAKMNELKKLLESRGVTDFKSNGKVNSHKETEITVKEIDLNLLPKINDLLFAEPPKKLLASERNKEN